MPSKLKLFGAGIRAGIVADLINWQFRDAFEVEGAYDDAIPTGQLIGGRLPVLGSTNDGVRDAENADDTAYLVTFGTRASAQACKLLLRLIQMGVRIPSLISPEAAVSPSAEFGCNTVVMPGVFIGCYVKVGNLVFIHGGASIEHGSRVGNNVLIGPGASLAGSVVIEDHCFVGAGSAVIPDVKVGVGSVLGAGSVVIRSVEPESVAVGHPARRVRVVTEGMEVPSPAQVCSLSSMGWTTEASENLPRRQSGGMRH